MDKALFKTDQGSIQMSNTPMWAGRLATIIGLGAAILHFNENPVAITFIIIALILLLLFAAHAKIVVCKDRFEYWPSSPIILWIKGKLIYNLNELEFVNTPVEYEVKDVATNKKYLNDIDSRDKIHISFKDGRNDLLSNIRRDQLLMAAIAINKQIKNLKQ